MNVDPYILAFSALTVIVTIWMGFWSAKKSKTASDFFVAGRSVSVGWNASAISGEYLSAASFMGVAGMVMSSGYDALWYPVCYACGYLFLLLFIAGPLRRFGAYTIPDFAEGRFDSPVFRKIAVVFVLFIGFFYTMPQMKGAGTTLAYIFPGLPYWAGVVLVGAVITLNVALGGMKGITLVQAFQYWAKMFAISVPIFVLMAVYGHYGKQVAVNGRVHAEPLAIVPVASLDASSVAKAVALRSGFIKIGSPLLGNIANHVDNHLRRITEHFAISTFKAPDVPTNVVGTSSSVWLNYDTALAFVQQTLITNGITLLKARDGLYAVPNSKAEAYSAWLKNRAEASRVPLPDKAPPDSTWLNPFGPLTTKAAKNAAAAIGKKAAASAQFENYFEEFALNFKTTSPLADVANVWRMERDAGVNTTESAAAALDEARGFVTSGMRAMTFLGAIGSYNAATQRPVFWLRDLTNSWNREQRPFPGFKMRLAKQDYIALLEAFLKTNGIGVVHAKEGAIMVHARDAEKIGQAYAAGGLAGIIACEVGRAVLSAPKRGVNSGASVAGLARRGENTAPYLAQKPIPLRAGLSPEQHMTVNLDSPTVAQVLAIYADLTGRQLLPNTNSVAERVDDLFAGALSKWKLISRTPAPDSGVSLHNDGAFTTAEVKSAIEARLRTNGLVLAAVGQRAFRVERAAGILLASGQSTYSGAGPENQVRLQDAGGTLGGAEAEKAWLDKHEKPLALLYTYSLIIALVCGTAGLPHILVRFYTNPDGVAAKRTTMWVMILIGVFYLFPPVFGVIGRNLMPELYAATGAKGTDKIVLELPRILNERYAPLGSILSGIACAGAFAAFMSTFSGLLVSMTGALAHDVYGRILRPKSTPNERMRMFKIGAVLIGGVAILLGMQVEQLQINFMVGQAFAIAAASYFPLLFMAVWWRKLTMKGAATGMLTGGLLALAGISLTSFSDLKWFDLANFWAMHPLLRILCEQPAIWTVPLAILLMIVVSKLTQREVPGDIRMKMLVLHAPEQLGLKQEYIQEQQHGH